MGITQFSFVLLPLCLFWAMKPTRLLHLMIIASVFESAAAVTIGSLGVQPGLVPAVIFLGFVALQLLLGAEYPGQRLTWQMSWPFVVVTIWAVVSSIVIPRLLQGQVYVWPQKSEPPFVITPLAPTASNLNQDLYLIIDCGLIVLISMFLTKPSIRLLPLIKIYLASGFLVAALAGWQLASKLVGVPYPIDFLYSNPGWAILTTQAVGFVPRINGPFSEPSSLAGYMGSIACASGWAIVQGHKGLVLRLLLITALLTMVLSTSTTGFVVLAIVGCGLPIYAFAKGDTLLISRVLKIGVPLLVTGAMIVFATAVINPQILANAQDVIDATLTKQDSSSYQERTSADLDSLNAFEDSFGLGTGWGSNRSSSLIPGLLASLGLPGILGLAWFIAGLTRYVRRARRTTASQDYLLIIDASCGSLVGTMLSAIISGPSISSVTFFFLIALMIGTMARIEMTALAEADAVRSRYVSSSLRRGQSAHELAR